MMGALEANIEAAPSNIQILQEVIATGKYPAGIYRNELEVKDGIRFWRGIAERRKI